MGRNRIGGSLDKPKNEIMIKKKWDFVYEEECPDTAGANVSGIISNGEDFLFFHVFAIEEGEPEICHIYSSLMQMFDGDEELYYPWTAENDSLLLDKLNNLSDPLHYCGDESELLSIDFN